MSNQEYKQFTITRNGAIDRMYQLRKATKITVRKFAHAVYNTTYDVLVAIDEQRGITVQ